LDERLVALESVDPDSSTERSEARDKSTDETQKQEHEKKEPQWGGNNPPPFPMPFAMPGMNGWPDFGIPYPIMGNPFRAGNFYLGDSTGYQRPYRNYQNRNSIWNQNQTNRDRQWSQQSLDQWPAAQHSGR